MPEIVACMNVYNEASTIKRAVDSVLQIADRVVAVDGRYPDFPGPAPNSDDGTIDILRGYGSKVTLLLCSEPRPQNVKRTMYLDGLNEGDWAFIMDGDEELVLSKPAEWVRDEILRHDEGVKGYYAQEVVDISGTEDWWPVIYRFEQGMSYDDTCLLVNRNFRPVLKRPPGARAVNTAGYYQFEFGMMPLYGCKLVHHRFGRPGERLARKFEYWKSQMVNRVVKAQ